MAKTVALSQQCPMEVGLNILSGKWTLRILWLVSKGPIRFNQLQREVGAITTKTLTQQLRTLEEQGMLRRTRLPRNPAQGGVYPDRAGADHFPRAPGPVRVGEAVPRKPVAAGPS